MPLPKEEMLLLAMLPPDCSGGSRTLLGPTIPPEEEEGAPALAALPRTPSPCAEGERPVAPGRVFGAGLPCLWIGEYWGGKK